MSRKYVTVTADVTCKWEGLPPTYRVFVNDELFAERTWDWADFQYLEETTQINAIPGTYHIRYELIPPHLAELTTSNIRVKGPGILRGDKLVIIDENT